MTLSFSGPSLTTHVVPPETRAPVALTTAPGLRSEWRTALEPVRLLAAAPGLLRSPRGSGGVVIDIPGFRASEASMAPLRAFLRSRGHDARGWGLGTNVGKPERDAVILTERVKEEFERTGAQVALVGWSLGGVIAREVARSLPEAVSQVITFGTPAVGGPTYTVAAKALGRGEGERIRLLMEELDRTDPIRVPITAIFTRRDHVVDWPACIDRASLRVEHVEVASTHVGLVVDPDVWHVVALRLADKATSPASSAV